MQMKLDLQKIRELGNIDLLARQLVEGFITGLHKSPYHGFSVEFAEHKPYNMGESTRDIDWKVYARTDKLFVKRYEEETNLRCNILIDNSSSMYYPATDFGKITFSITAAASLAFVLQRQRDAVGICTFSDRIESQTPIKSTASHLHKVFLSLERILSKTQAPKKTSIPEVLHQIAGTVHKRSLIIIFSDMFDNEEKARDIFAALHHLKHNKHEVLLFHVTEKNTEFDFDFSDRPHEFIDMETKEKIKISPPQIRDHYIRRVREYIQELKIRCGQFKIDFIEADIHQPVDKVLLSYLIKRKKMR